MPTIWTFWHITNLDTFRWWLGGILSFKKENCTNQIIILYFQIHHISSQSWWNCSLFSNAPFNTSIPSRNMFQEKWIWNRRKMRHLHLISPQGLIDRFSSWLVQSFSSCKARTHQCPVITLNFQRECLFLDLLEFSGSQAEIRSSFSLNSMQFGFKKYAKCVNC